MVSGEIIFEENAKKNPGIVVQILNENLHSERNQWTCFWSLHTFSI
jgi:hypothetical protein